MGEKRPNCIYVDAEKKWWAAAADIIGDSDIVLIEEKTEALQKIVCDSKGQINFINALAPQIIALDHNADWQRIEPFNRKVVYPK